MAVLSRIFSIFILIVIGYAARKTKVLDPSLTRGLSGFILNVAIPFTIIAGFDRNIPSSVLPDLGRVALWAVGIHGFLIAFSSFAYRKFPENDRKVLSYITVFSNCGFMGFPVAESVFGKIGVMYASIYVIVFQIFIWTYGVSLFAGSSSKSQMRAAILNTGNASVLIGLALWLLPFKMPQAIDSTIVTMASLTTPLSMVVVGATLADVPIAGLLKGKSLWIGTVIRIILIPLLIYGLMRLGGIDSFPARIAAFLTAMPAAAQSVIFAERYDSNVGLASKLVFITTILSAFTIPVFAVLLN
ncbi:MAG: AEC family transporter [Spirochaetae bacterium HGW-Spirochaetae-9]|nr:MAG: AEC family transporter [Spirochaetae bacterium HGW-Spirochaetae-9]